MKRLLHSFLALTALATWSLVGEQISPAFAQWVATTFQVGERTDVSFAAVGVAYPSFPGKDMAFDLAPSPGATADVDNGWSWFDACDHDPRLDPTNVYCSRMGIKPGWAEFGYMHWDAAPMGGIRFRIGPNTVGEVTIDPTNHDPVWTIHGSIKARSFDVAE